MPRKKKQVEAVPEKPPETLSEWMRLGFRHFQPLTGDYASPLGSSFIMPGPPGYACPIGCAVLMKNPAAQGLNRIEFGQEAKDQFDELRKQLWLTPTNCPDFFRDPNTGRIDRSVEGRNIMLHFLITYLNDIIKLPRERIADVVEGLGF